MNRYFEIPHDVELPENEDYPIKTLLNQAQGSKALEAMFKNYTPQDMHEILKVNIIKIDASTVTSAANHLIKNSFATQWKEIKELIKSNIENDAVLKDFEQKLKDNKTTNQD